MDMRDIRELSDEDLETAILDKREEMFNLRFQQASGQLENVNYIRFAKRELARLLTVQRERELAAQVMEEERNAE